MLPVTMRPQASNVIQSIAPPPPPPPDDVALALELPLLELLLLELLLMLLLLLELLLLELLLLEAWAVMVSCVHAERVGSPADTALTLT